MVLLGVSLISSYLPSYLYTYPFSESERVRDIHSFIHSFHLTLQCLDHPVVLEGIFISIFLFSSACVQTYVDVLTY